MRSNNKSSQKVSAVVVTYNRKKYLIECLNALLNQTYPINNIYIIDNASTDGTMKFLKDYHFIDDVELSEFENIEIIKEKKNVTLNCNTNIHYIRLKENTGGAGGFYEGVKRSYQDGCDWLWLMDDDVIPANDCLEKLIYNLGYHENVGALMPLRVTSNGEIVGYERISLNYINPFRQYGGKSLRELFGNENHIPSEGIQIANFPFEGPLIKTEVIQKIGLPRPEFFIMADDTDYSIRIAALYKIILVPKAKIIKVLFSQSDKINWKDYYYCRNLIYLDRLYGTKLVSWLRPILFTLENIYTNCFKRKQFKKIRVYLLALLHGYCKKMGKTIQPGS